MNIGALSSQFLDQEHIPFASSIPAHHSGNGFDELLKRAQNREISASSKKSPIDKSDKLYELCQDLETFLIKNLIKSMRSTVQKTKLIDPGFAGEMYEDMLYDEYAKDFSRNANFGFAEMAYRDLTGYR